ncbi:MAG: hypothetical protein A2902_01570 [Elusimicrobia bacterium RIFCSPLOWO2_01_FULL_64_13]|nr:MAG: hypothetical protein A2636_06765 [Elusimicrobia bacterium RIFCSPHIGHO2_01_FULL_64_10]OGR95521.1 MAG: hypothetical protein A2902_01570 [Elusimicrobia bacterium RIFCSPLOWO2_01_FULL_64_13]
MKIDLVCPFFSPTVGGAESYSQGIASGMAAKGHDVTVHTSLYNPVTRERYPASEKMEPGFAVRRYDPSFRLYHYYWWWRPEIAKTDLIHLVCYGHACTELTLSRYLGRFPIVNTTGMVDVPIQGPRSAWIKERYDRLIGVKRLKSVGKLILWYQNERHWCLERGIPESQIEVLPIGIPGESFSAYDAGPIKRREGLIRYILYLGRIHPQRGVLSVAEAFSKIAGRFPDVDLVLAGPDNGALAEVRKISGKRGVSARVKHLGVVLGRRKYELISGCEFVAYPPMRELQGVVLLEAMAQKKAVISSGLDNGLPDYLRDGENGLQIKFGDIDGLADKMALLLTDDGLRRRLGEEGRGTAERFRLDKILDRTERIYLDVLNRTHANGTR